MKTRFLFVVLVASLTFVGCGAHPDPTPVPTPTPSFDAIALGYNSVDEQGESTGDMLTLADRMAFWDVPGVSIALIRDYKIVWSEGFGIADGEIKQPVGTDTLFSAGSISKSLTAMGVMALVQKGVLDLDRNVNDYLVSWKVPENQYTAQEKITLRRLLSHTTGIPTGYAAVLRDQPVPTVQELLADVSVVRTPGSQYEYSNNGFLVVEQLLTDVTGKPFAQYMEETVLRPAGMTHSTFEQPLPEQWWDKAAAWHDTEPKPLVGKWGVIPYDAAGGLWTTPSDLATLAIEIMQTYRGESSKVLSRESVQKMLTPQVLISPAIGGGYGLGFIILGEGGNTSFSHSGSTPLRNKGRTYDSYAYFVGLPDTGHGVAITINGAVGNALITEILYRAAVEEGWPGSRVNVAVTVQDGQGNPVSGAIVSSSAQPYGQEALRGKTGSDGTVTFSNVCVGTYGFQAYRGSTSAPGQRLVLQPGTNRELTLVLRE